MPIWRVLTKLCDRVYPRPGMKLGAKIGVGIWGVTAVFAATVLALVTTGHGRVSEAIIGPCGAVIGGGFLLGLACIYWVRYPR